MEYPRSDVGTPEHIVNASPEPISDELWAECFSIADEAQIEEHKNTIAYQAGQLKMQDKRYRELQCRFNLFSRQVVQQEALSYDKVPSLQNLNELNSWAKTQGYVEVTDTDLQASLKKNSVLAHYILKLEGRLGIRDRPAPLIWPNN